jgi:hypothetical protein
MKILLFFAVLPLLAQAVPENHCWLDGKLIYRGERSCASVYLTHWQDFVSDSRKSGFSGVFKCVDREGAASFDSHGGCVSSDTVKVELVGGFEASAVSTPSPLRFSNSDFNMSDCLAQKLTPVASSPSLVVEYAEIQDKLSRLQPGALRSFWEKEYKRLIDDVAVWNKFSENEHKQRKELIVIISSQRQWTEKKNAIIQLNDLWDRVAAGNTQRQRNAKSYCENQRQQQQTSARSASSPSSAPKPVHSASIPASRSVSVPASAPLYIIPAPSTAFIPAPAPAPASVPVPAPAPLETKNISFYHPDYGLGIYTAPHFWQSGHGKFFVLFLFSFGLTLLGLTISLIWSLVARFRSRHRSAVGYDSARSDYVRYYDPLDYDNQSAPRLNYDNQPDQRRLTKDNFYF